MKVNREDVVQAALTVERWCKSSDCSVCPFFLNLHAFGCKLVSPCEPCGWELEEHLRNRGMKHENEGEDAGG